jgi:hypothetical protein
MKCAVKFIAVVVLISALNCFASQFYFKNNPNSTDPNNYANVANWLDSTMNPAAVLPGATDQANFIYPPVQCYLATTASIKYFYDSNSGHFVFKNGANLTVSKQCLFGYSAPNTNVLVDVNAGATITCGRADPSLAVGDANNSSAVMNIQGTVTGPSDSIIPSNWMCIPYGAVDTQNTDMPYPNQSGVVNVSGNGKLIGFWQIIVSYIPGTEKGTLNIQDYNSTVTATSVYCNGGPATINVHNGLMNPYNLIMPWGGIAIDDHQYSHAVVNVSGNGRVLLRNGPYLPDSDASGNFNITLLGNLVMCAVPPTGALDPNYSGTLNINDANSVVDCNGLVAGEAGPAYINVNNGSLSCNTLYLTYPTSLKGEYGACQINLYGGTLTVRKNWQPGYNSARNGGNDRTHVDIRAGKLVVPLAQQSNILSDISLGIIKAYEGTGRLIITTDSVANTLTITGCPSAGPVPGDVNNDCKVNWLDLNLLAQNWLAAGTSADLNSDGRVNIKDYAIIAGNWLYNN